MFITLEGIEGSGKSTQLAAVVDFIEARGLACAATREPGGTPVGGKIRSILLDPENRGLDPGAELLLYVADRVQHLRTVILPMLAAGRVVVCDRFFDATLVYQGYARGLSKQMILALHRLVCDNMQPDATLLFDLDPQVGLQRAWGRIHSQAHTDRESRFEQEKIDFHQRVREGYLTLARQEPQRFHVIDAERSRAQVTGAVESILERLLPLY
jgi:dTMP kinase